MCYTVLHQTSFKTHESCIFCTLSFDEKFLDHCKKLTVFLILYFKNCKIYYLYNKLLKFMHTRIRYQDEP